MEEHHAVNRLNIFAEFDHSVDGASPASRVNSKAVSSAPAHERGQPVAWYSTYSLNFTAAISLSLPRVSYNGSDTQKPIMSCQIQSWVQLEPVVFPNGSVVENRNASDDINHRSGEPWWSNTVWRFESSEIQMASSIMTPVADPRVSMTTESGPWFFAQKGPRYWGVEGHGGECPIRRSWSGLHSLIGCG